MDKRIFHLKKYITENLDKEFSIEELAEKVNLSATYLSRLFKNETGVSPIRFIINIRLAEAEKILTAEEFPIIKQIALQVGFADQSRFIREFKKTFGVSPKSYLKQKWLEKEKEIEAQNKS